nr:MULTISPECIES: ACP S-malonyltransferase [unclassified Oleiphilus]
MTTVFMFPGQGSQSIGMMSDLLAQSELAVKTFTEASEAIGEDLQDIALNGPEDKINQTEITQPIVLTASVAMWRTWIENSDIRPDYVCGHSLGEYTALIASGVLDFEETVKLVNLRGKLMQGAVPLGEGGMVALLGLDDDKAKEACKEAAQGQVVAPANFNSPGQIVISGATDALDRAMAIAKEKGARRTAKLPVSVPCHCDLLQPAGEELANAMSKLTFKEPGIPIVQNVNAQVATNLEELKTNLLAHLHSPVLWSQSVTKLIELGADTFVECGPGKVLAGLNKRIDKTVNTMAMSDVSSLEKVVSGLSD